MVLRRIVIGSVKGDGADALDDFVHVNVELELGVEFLDGRLISFQHFGRDEAADFGGAELGGIELNEPFGIRGDFFPGDGAGDGGVEDGEEERENESEVFHTMDSAGI